MALGAFLLSKTVEDYGWFSLLIAIPFPLAMLIFGLIPLSTALVNRYARHMVELDEEKLVFHRYLLGIKTRIILPRPAIRHITRIRLQRHSDKREGIEIQGGKHKLRFGNTLTPAERAWLVADLREQVFGTPETFQAVRSMTDSLPARFSFRVTHRLTHYLPFACALIVIAVLFLFVVLRFMDIKKPGLDPDDPLFISILEWLFTMLGNVMRLIFLIISLGMLGGGFTMILNVFRKHGCTTLVEGDESIITVRRQERGRVLSERVHQRREVTGMRAVIHTHTGGVSCKRIELLTQGKPITVAAPVLADEADAIVANIGKSSDINATAT